MADAGYTKVLGKKGKKLAKFAPVVVDKSTVQAANLLAAKAHATKVETTSVPEILAKYDSAEKTVCYMYWLSSAGQLMFSYAVSSYPKDIKSNLSALRTTCGIDKAKKSVCAEEQVVAHVGNGSKFLFSVAFDSHGRKKACGGCKKILAAYAIIDLVP